LNDVRGGRVSSEAAARDYGVVIHRRADDFVVDSDRTAALRAETEEQL
jgi:hypothetical protein